MEKKKNSAADTNPPPRARKRAMKILISLFVGLKGKNRRKRKRPEQILSETKKEDKNKQNR